MLTDLVLNMIGKIIFKMNEVLAYEVIMLCNEAIKKGFSGYLIVEVIADISVQRLDSSEMDHSENEDYTMSSPLPGKKSDKRDDSDLVRVRCLVDCVMLLIVIVLVIFAL